MGDEKRRWSDVSFGVLFALSLALFVVVVLLPFLKPVLVATFVVVLTYPLCDRLTRALGGRRKIASALMTIGVFLLILVPGVLLGLLVAQQVADFVTKLGEGGFDVAALARETESPALRSLIERAREFAAGGPEQWWRALSGLFERSLQVATQALGTVTELFIALFLMFVSLYYLYLDGRSLAHSLVKLVPLEDRYERQFFREFQDVSYAILVGELGTAVAHGLVGALGYAIAGVDNILIWAVLTAVASLLPTIGTALVWVPISAALLFSGDTGRAIFLAAYGTVVIGGIDNVLRPILVKGRLTLHPLLVFLSIFGGITLFGLIGILIGPLVAAIFMASVRIYENDYLRRVHA